MTVLEALQSVQYITVKDRRFAVLDAADWDALVEWLEALEDLQAFRESEVQLEQAGGDPDRAGWLRWEEVRDQLK